jgi:hypothetical protein
MSANVYYNPDKWGLEVIADLELYEPNYSFDTVVAWRHVESGEVYWAWDSGCSCPIPFENYKSLEDLTRLSSENFAELEDLVKNCYQPNAKADFLRDVALALDGKWKRAEKVEDWM